MLAVVMVLGFISATTAIPCEEANMKCSFRTGCGNALKGYVLACSSILKDIPSDQCPEDCQTALIALTSTDEGRDLMTCECSNNTFCKETKQKLEVCRPHVAMAIKNDSIVTCEVAQWICIADASCSKALEYYHKYCQSMFYGRKCSSRCKNSIAILRKQEKAAKLDTCRCNGREEYDCPGIRRNMDRLCFNKTVEYEIHNGVENDIKSIDDQNNHSNEIDNAAARVSSLKFLILMFLISKFLT